MLLGLVLMMMPGLAAAQGAAATSAPAPLFTTSDAWMAGGFAAATVLAMPFDERLAEWMQQPARQTNSTLRTTATVFRTLADPGTVVIAGGLWVVGRLLRDETMADVGLHSGEAIVASSVAGWAIKSLAGRARPRVDIHRPQDFQLGRGFGTAGNYQSFPSGHTLAAFSLASAVTAEAGHFWPRKQILIGLLTYGGATLSGVSRMYNDAHWASDVILGAGLGTLSGLVVVGWQHGHPGNWVDRTLLDVSLVPAPDGRLAVGLHLTPW